MQTATNDQTGETAVLVNGQWQKADRIASNDKGQKAYLVGGQWMADDGGKAEKPATGSIGRAAGLATRAVGPVAAGAAAGALMGAPLGGVGAIPGAAAGAGAATLLQIADSMLGTNYLEQAMDKLGLPRPETGGEQVVSDVMRGVAGGAGAAGVGQVLSQSTRPVVQSVGQTLTSNLGTQMAADAAASGASGVTRELGGGQTAQLVAGLAGGIAAPAVTQRVMNAPHNVLANSVQKSEAKPFSTEGNRLAADTGIDLTLGARTGNKQVLGLENAARQYGQTADRVQDIDIKIANQAIKRVETIADTISKRKLDPATIGTAIEDTVKGAANKLDSLRDSNAGRDYGVVRQIAGDRPVITMTSFTAELRKLVDEYSNVAGSDAQKVVSQAKAALSKVTESKRPGPWQTTLASTAPTTEAATNPINDAMRSRRFYGAASRGSANVFEDIAPDLNRMIGGRLFRAINDDFDGAATNADGALRKALDTANTNYRKASQSIEFLEKSTLGKLVGEDIADAALSGARMSTTPGEAVINKLMASHPSSRKTAVEILQRWNPELAKDVRSFVLRDALDKGMSLPPSQRGASQVPISFNRFVSALQGDKVSFHKQLESYGFAPKEIKDVMDTVQAMVRAGDRTGYNFSGTNVQKENLEMAGAMGQAAMGNIKGAATKMLAIGGKMFGLNKIADAMATREGREALRTVASPKATPQAVFAAMSTLGEDTNTAQPKEQ